MGCLDFDDTIARRDRVDYEKQVQDKLEERERLWKSDPNAAFMAELTDIERMGYIDRPDFVIRNLVLALKRRFG